MEATPAGQGAQFTNKPIGGRAGATVPHPPAAGVAMSFSQLLTGVLVACASASATAADAAERKFIREGMMEGEVVLKIGKPDHEALVRAIKGEPEEKTWTYFPHYRDPQTLTVLTLHAGLVSKIERKIAR